MKRIITGVAAAVLALAGYILYRALSLPAPLEVEAAPPPATIDSQDVARRLSTALKFQTISYGDGVKEAERSAALDEMRAWLDRTYPNFHDAAGPEAFGKSLLFTWIGKNPNLLPVLVMAHMDVVPVVPGTEKDWTHAPFSGDIAEGFVWGRGALDDKASLVAIFDAAERLAIMGYQPERTIMFAFGEDEEVGGTKGNAAIAKALTSRGTKFAWVLDEFSPIMNEPYPGVHRPLAFVAVAEKGYLSLELVAHGQGGHAALPSRDLALERLSNSILNVLHDPFVSDLDDVQRATLSALAPMVPFGDRLMLANLWLAKPLIMQQMEAEPVTAAILHTTISPTILQAGIKDNVIPPTARGVINFRLHRRDTIASVTEHVKQAIKDSKVDVTELKESSSEASKIADMDGPAYTYLRDTIQTSFGVPVAPTILSGQTDSRYYLPITESVLRFSPFHLERSDLERMHGTNERVAVADLGPAVGFDMRLIQNVR